MSRIHVDSPLAILALLAAVLAAPTAARAEPLLQNASFEEPLDPVNFTCDMAKGWPRYGHWMNRETGWRPTKSGDCLIGYHHWEINGTENSGISQSITDVLPGKEYTFSIHAFLDPDTNAESILLRLSDGKDILAEQLYGIATLVKKEWTTLSVSGKAKSQKLFVNVIVQPLRKVQNQWDRKGAIKFDDADFHATESYH
jgi:hypothetical protein